MYQRYNLDLIPQGIPVRVRVKQYDSTARQILFKLHQGGEKYEIPDDSVVTLSGTKPDGNGYSSTVTFSGSNVYVYMRSQLTPLAGIVPCQLTISQTNGNIGTATFDLVVEAAALGSDTPISKTEISTFQQLTATAQTAATQAQAAASDAAASAQGAQQVKGSCTGNLDELTSPGVYWCNLADCTNGPLTSGYGYLEIWKSTASCYFQRLTLYSSGVSYYRGYTNSQWYSWVCRNTLEALSTHGSYTGNLNTLNEPGVYWCNLSNCTNGPLTSGYGYLEVCKASSQTWFQRFTRWMSAGGPCVAIRFWSYAAGAFMPWAWDSPSMASGTEYLTTERWGGSPVYTKIVDCGTMPSKTGKEVAHGAAAATVIRVCGTMSNGRSLPFANTTSGVATVSADKTNIILKTDYDTTTTAVVQIWYTKD